MKQSLRLFTCGGGGVGGGGVRDELSPQTGRPDPRERACAAALWSRMRIPRLPPELPLRLSRGGRGVSSGLASVSADALSSAWEEGPRLSFSRPEFSSSRLPEPAREDYPASAILTFNTTPLFVFLL